MSEQRCKIIQLWRASSVGNLFLVGVLAAAPIEGDAQWLVEASNASPLFTDVCIVDEGHVWAAGWNGVLWKRGELGWNAQSSGIGTNFQGVWFTDTLQGWIVGSSGVLRRTVDGGQTWFTQTTGTTSALNDVVFSDPAHGWVVGNSGVLLKSSNGGVTWTSASAGVTMTLTNLFFLDGSTGWMVGALGTILKTTNGGSTWLPQTSNTTTTLRQIAFSTALNGWVVGDNGTLLHTTDAGQTWVPVTSLQSTATQTVAVVDEQHVFVGGGNEMYYTDDGGGTWTFQHVYQTRAVQFKGPTVGFAVGSNSSILRYRMTDTLQWTMVPSPTLKHLTSVVAIDDTMAWAVGWNGAMLRWDGTTWANRPVVVNTNLDEVLFTHPDTGWVVGGTCVLLRTTNGGDSWTSEQLVPAGFHLEAIAFAADHRYGWIAGNSGTILRTTDHGATWTLQQSPVNYGLADVIAIDSNTALIGGPAGTIMKTTDGGENWLLKPTGTAYTVTSLRFANPDTGIAVAGTSILHTVDGGETWAVLAPVTKGMQQVCFINDSVAWGVAPPGVVYKTQNGGATWATELCNSAAVLRDISLVEATNGWAVGEYGAIVRYTNGGVSVAARSLLEGAYDEDIGLMRDDLRQAGLLPNAEPYTAMGYALGGYSGEIVEAGVFDYADNSAVVDWVAVELRNANYGLVAARAGLLRRDGEVVGVDGISPLHFAVPVSTYYIVLHHRNHLGIMTGSAVSLELTPSLVDFTLPSTALYGTNATKQTGLSRVMWAGDVTGDGIVKYTGSGNDRDPILTAVGSTTPNATIAPTYSTRDVNLDGSVKYTGSGNDRDPILVNVGSTTPNNVRVQQLP